ncbi:MAG: transcription termination/antitermination NusG family protein [Clostridia bacterium]|nr:transcription termination/antitermination NusG family protein [Clostridia bacterium]
MIWMYAIAASSGNEQKAAEQLRKIDKIKIHMPRNIIAERRGGVWHEKEKMLIPGYLFVECILTPEIYYGVKESSFVSGWIGKGQPVPMSEEDAEFIFFMANGGKPIPMLKFDSPFLKKSIIRAVDKRQKRIKATIMVMGKSHTVTFGYLS